MALKQLTTLHWALILSVGAHAGLLAFRIADPTRFERAFRDYLIPSIRDRYRASAKL